MLRKVGIVGRGGNNDCFIEVGAYRIRPRTKRAYAIRPYIRNGKNIVNNLKFAFSFIVKIQNDSNTHFVLEKHPRSKTASL